jgi:hypothetical protein
MAASGASGLTLAFLPVQKAALNRAEQFNDVTRQVTSTVNAQTDRGIRTAAGESFDIASAALQGRGNQINLLA